MYYREMFFFFYHLFFHPIIQIQDISIIYKLLLLDMFSFIYSGDQFIFNIKQVHDKFHQGINKILYVQKFVVIARYIFLFL